MAIPINLVFEDELTESVLIKLLNAFGNKYHSGISYKGSGFGYIKSKINGFNQASIAIPFLVLTDLDKKSCPLDIITKWFTSPIHPNMIFRIAVREVEAWLLADIDGYSTYLGISKYKFPADPEKVDDPKMTLINLTKHSRKKAIKNDIVPINQYARIGPNYNGRLMDFVLNHWDLNRAIKNSQSLRRAHTKLAKFEFQQPN